MEENEKDMIELQKLGLDEPIPVTDENKSRNDGKWCKIFREVADKHAGQQAGDHRAVNAYPFGVVRTVQRVPDHRERRQHR